MFTIDFTDYAHVQHLRQTRGKPFVVAHRGASAEAPENTVQAFQLALNQGAHIIETDLWFTRDRQLALLHDRTLDRTTGQAGVVTEMELAELRNIPTLMPGSQTATTYTIPALTELLDLVQQRQAGLLLELKDPRFALPGYGNSLVDLLRTYGMMSSTLIVSFSIPCLQAMRRICPALRIGRVGLKILKPDRQWDLSGPPYTSLLANPLFMPLARRYQSLVAPLDPHPERRVGYYRRIGVDAILADNVAQIVDLLETDETAPPA